MKILVCEELKYSSIILPESNDTEVITQYAKSDLFHCHKNNKKRLENDGKVAHKIKVLTRSVITSTKPHSNAGIFPKICLFCSSSQKKVKRTEEKLINIENSEFQENVVQYATWVHDQPMLTKITAVYLISKEAKYHAICRAKYQTEAEPTLEGLKI